MLQTFLTHVSTNLLEIACLLLAAYSIWVTLVIIDLVQDRKYISHELHIANARLQQADGWRSVGAPEFATGIPTATTWTGFAKVARSIVLYSAAAATCSVSLVYLVLFLLGHLYD